MEDVDLVQSKGRGRGGEEKLHTREKQVRGLRTRIASFRTKMVGTRFGIRESILRRSRGCPLTVSRRRGHKGTGPLREDLRSDGARNIGLPS